MRFVKFLASAIFSLIIILAIGGYLAVRNFDLNKYKVYAEDIASRELGRELKINGDASIGISLIPTVVVNDIELANPNWAQNPQMLKLKQVEIKFALAPLMRKQIVIDKVILNEPEIYLEKSSNGEVSWDFAGLKAKSAQVAAPTAVKASPAAQASGAAMLAGLQVGNVAINNGKVEYYDAKSNQISELLINNISMSAPETTLKTKIDGDVSGLTSQIETLNVVTNVITGTAAVDWASRVPQISADLQSSKINLLSFQTKNNFAFYVPALISEAQALDAVPNTLIPYDFLNMADANLKLKIGQLVLAQGMTANNVRANAVLKNGKLVVNPLALDFGGGEIKADISADAKTKSVSIRAASKNMLLQNLHKEFAVDGATDFGFKNGGNLDMDISLAGSGATYRQLMQNMKGQIIGIVGKSVVQTGGLRFVSGNFVTQLLSALRISQSTSTDLDLTCAVVRADIAAGKVSFPNGIAVDSKQLTVVSDGKLNLINDNISFTIAPSLNKLAKGNIAQALASFIKVGGTIQDPKILLDNQEALKTVVGVVATGGVAYLGSQVMLNGDGAPCYTALKGTAYASRFPKPTGVKATTQDVYNDTTQQLKDGVKDLKNTAKDILGILKKQ